jgi:hypothetical protein
MKKILVLVMVLGMLVLSGCDNTGEQAYWEYDSNKPLEDKIEEVLITLQEIVRNNLLISINEEELLDRLDTIDMNIDRIDDEREVVVGEYITKECVTEILDELLYEIINHRVGEFAYNWDDKILVHDSNHNGEFDIEDDTYTLDELSTWCG